MKSKTVLQSFPEVQMTEKKIMFPYKIRSGRSTSLSIPSCTGVSAPGEPGSLVVHNSEGIYRKNSSVYYVYKLLFVFTFVRGLMCDHILSLFSFYSSDYWTSVWKIVLNFWVNNFSQCFGNNYCVFGKLDV